MPEADLYITLVVVYIMIIVLIINVLCILFISSAQIIYRARTVKNEIKNKNNKEKNDKKSPMRTVYALRSFGLGAKMKTRNFIVPSLVILILDTISILLLLSHCSNFYSSMVPRFLFFYRFIFLISIYSIDVSIFLSGVEAALCLSILTSLIMILCCCSLVVRSYYVLSVICIQIQQNIYRFRYMHEYPIHDV